MNIYAMIYCGIYKLFEKGSDSLAEYSAVFVLAVIIPMNIFAALKLIGMSQTSFSSDSSLKLYLASSYLIMVIINYFMFVKDANYKSQLKKFGEISLTKIRIVNYVSIFLILESIIIPFVV